MTWRKGKMEQWQELLNKSVKVIYEDGQDHYSSKFGTLTEVNNTHLILKIKDKTIAINLSKVLRIEEVEKNDFN